MPDSSPPAARWIENHWDELRDLPFNWVAATAEGRVAASEDLGEVIAAVLDRGLSPDEVCYALVDDPIENDRDRT